MLAAIIVIVIVVVAAAAAGFFVLRRRALRRQFGAEYDRLAEEVGPRRAREELRERSRVVADLEIRPLTPGQRDEYTRRWDAAQEAFVDSPARATQTGLDLLTAVAGTVGYTADDEEKLRTELSVRHGGALEGYRRARDASGQASAGSTEVLRQSLLAYRTLFRELTGEANGSDATTEAADIDHESDQVAVDASKE